MNNPQVSVSAPGRICLFGEHQDYLKLPVITAAINLRVGITGRANESERMCIDLPDIGKNETLPLLSTTSFYAYEKERDYFRSMVNVLKKSGYAIQNGCDCRVQGEIPINSGTSSSSALIVAWGLFLLAINRHHPLSSADAASMLALLAYSAEVTEFGEPGGMMDHYATALGGVLYQSFEANVQIEPMKHLPGTFVLGDSLQAKDTKAILGRVKMGVLAAIDQIRKSDPDFNLETGRMKDLDAYADLLTDSQREVTRGAVLNRQITREAKQLFNKEPLDHRAFGNLLNEHQEILATQLKISTPKIDLMLKQAIAAGAYGGKINGSGGGGCMFVYAPEDPQKVADAIEKAGGRAYIVTVDRGVEISSEGR